MSAAAILDAGAHAVVAKRLAPGPKRRDNETRFWSKVEKTDGCWLWRAGVDKDGYGKFAVTMPRGTRPKQRHVRAHHYAYELAHGPLPPGTLLMHACDTPACVRPDHLTIGTHAENHADSARKGRRSGARNGFAKLNDATATEVVRLHAAGATPREIANRLGLSYSRAWAIATGRAWKHLPRANGAADASR